LTTGIGPSQSVISVSTPAIEITARLGEGRVREASAPNSNHTSAAINPKTR
jgi:hypothetical protein